MLMHTDFLPLRVSSAFGMACLPIPYNTESEVFFWAFFIMLILIIPTGYICGVVYNVYKRGL